MLKTILKQGKNHNVKLKNNFKKEGKISVELKKKPS